ncbi:MAG: acyltransferase, partial [Ferruginibacter sp.]
MKPIRQTWIDYARGISIILVLYRHVFEGLKNSGLAVADYISLEHANILFFSFRMPLFFIVSGIFVAGSLQKRGLKLFVNNKSRTILYPYFLWGIIQITIQILLSGYVNSHRTVHDYVYLLYLPRAIEQFWYLYALFNVSVIYAVSKSVFKLSAVKNIVIGLIFIYISSWTSRNQISIGFLGDILHYYFFYAIGDLIGRFIRDKNNIEKLYSWKISALLLIPFIISQVFYLYQNLNNSPKTYDYVENYQPYIFIIIAITGCAFIISICFLLQKANKIKWLHQLGKHS